MSLLHTDEERRHVAAVARLADLNPFLLDTRSELERQAAADVLGPAAVPPATQAPADTDLRDRSTERDRMQLPTAELAERLRSRLLAGERATRDELEQYQALVLYVLFNRYQPLYEDLIVRAEGGQPSTIRVVDYRKYESDYAHFLKLPRVALPNPIEVCHLFAWGFQLRRAYYHTFRQIIGTSRPAAELRARVWESIFTHDQLRYRRGLYERMGDITTLILGESGTGKELVARAIGLSRYVPFDAKELRFTEDYVTTFHPVNLSALSSSLIESELFGHRKGAFTGAQSDHAGWLEVCSALGTVFLDEIGELDQQIQVKLLRVLQERRFQRVGETQQREFSGKVVAATNRDLAHEIAERRFRSDLYYRLCGDVIRSPSLREQLRDAPQDLDRLVAVLCTRVAGPAEGPALAREVVAWIDSHLGRDYAWPGNVRELEQCVRNVLVHAAYEPRHAPVSEAAIADALAEGTLTADALLRQYCTQVYARTGSYEEAARRLELDRRTVKAKIDAELLERLRGGRETK